MTTKTNTTRTSRSKTRALELTTELYTGDIVEFDAFDKATDGKQFKVLATNSPCSCESGTLVCVAPLLGKGVKRTVDRYWLKLVVKASSIEFDDDIPF